MNLKISIQVDTNDGDYITEESDITKEQLELIKPLIAKIKKFRSYKGSRDDWKYNFDHNYPTGECLRTDLGEFSPREIYKDIDDEVFDVFEEFIPYCDYGFHTIEKIEVYPKFKKERLL